MLSNLLRAELYRMVHLRMTWVYLLVYAVVVATYGRFSGAGPLPVATVTIAGAFAGCYFADGLSTGFLRSTLVGRGARVRYVGAALASVAVVGAVYLLVGMAIIAVARPATAGVCGWASAGAAARWAFQALCVVVASGSAVLFVALGTASRGLAAFAGLCAGSDLLGGVASLVAGRVDGILWGSPNEFVLERTLSEQMTTLAQGLTCDAALLYPTVVVMIAVFGSLTVAVMRRRDVCGHAE